MRLNEFSDISFVVCLLTITPAVTSAQWMELNRPHYSIFYQAGFDADARLVRQWADSTEHLMKDKYGVVPVHYRMAIYLHPAPSRQADVNNAYNHCCTQHDGDSVSTGTIDMLAPSAPAFRSTAAISSLGLPKSSPDYSAKIFVSEYILPFHRYREA